MANRQIFQLNPRTLALTDVLPTQDPLGLDEAGNNTVQDIMDLIPLVAGPGVEINGLAISSSLVTVNGSYPVNGNVSVALSATVTGTSASLVSSGSGNVTASITNGTVWVVSGDAPANNGTMYIYVSASVGQWYPVAPLDTAAADARYLMLTPQAALSGSLNMGGNNLNNAGSIFATSVSASGNSTFNGQIIMTQAGGGKNTTLDSSNNTTAHTTYLPDQNGTLALSVNGVAADNSGSITITTVPTASYVASAVSSSYPISISGSSIYSAYPSTTAFSTTAAIALGSNAGRNGSNNSVSIGPSAGYLANGGSAGQAIFIGNAAGYNTLYASTTIVIGTYAGTSNTNFNNTVAIGDYAGSDVGNGGASVYLGNRAGWTANTTTGVVFVGSYAGYNADSSYNSVIIGPSAGYNAASSNGAVMIGAEAGSGANTTQTSIFVGYQAGKDAAGAGISVMIGNSAGYAATGATFSNLIGYQAGAKGGGATGIGSNNVIIGTNITLPDGTTDSINLGGIIFATGSYNDINAANPFSGSMFGTGKVGINKVTPEYTLDVSGSGNFSNGLNITGSLLVNGSPVGSTFPFTGSAQITGSLGITGSMTLPIGPDSSNPYKMGVGVANIRTIYPIPTTSYLTTNWNNLISNGPGYDYYQSQFPSFKPYFSTGGNNSGGDNNFYYTIGHLGIGANGYDPNTGTTKLEAIYLRTAQAAAPDASTLTAATSVVTTVVSDNNTISSTANITTLATANGRAHILVVTGSMLARDGVSLGVSSSNQHYITGSVNVSGSMTTAGRLYTKNLLLADTGMAASVVQPYNGYYGSTPFTPVNAAATASGAPAWWAQSNSSADSLVVGGGQNMYVSDQNIGQIGITNQNTAQYWAGAIKFIRNKPATDLNTGVIPYHTLITDNATIDEVDATLTTMTANGRVHVLAVTGSMLAIDGVSLGTAISNQHYITGSVAVTGSMNVANTVTFNLANYSDDVAAAAGGVPVGGLYRNGNVVSIRIS